MENQQLEGLIGLSLQDSSGEKIGKINDIYLDDSTGEPEWLAVETGLFGTHMSFVPMTDIKSTGDRATTSFLKEKVKDAPRCDADGSLSQDEEAALYAHYGYQYSEQNSDSGLPAEGEEKPTAGHDTSGPNTDSAMTRSEEEMRISKSNNEVGRARLRKYLVTEQKTVTVPVTREEVRLEREPITSDNVDAATSGAPLSEEEHEIILHEEQINVTKVVVPKERVRLDTETVVEEKQVSTNLTKEQIDVDNEPNG